VSDVTSRERAGTKIQFPQLPCEQNLMQLLGENVTNSYIEKLIEEVDKDGDGR